MIVLMRHNLLLKDPPEALRLLLMKRLTLLNPRWVENQRMGRYNFKTPKELTFFWRTRGGGLVIPRGTIRQLIGHCRELGVALSIDDRRRRLPPVAFSFSGRLKGFQQTAVDAMLAKDFGTLSAPTGSGKTVMALDLIARRRQPALIVVHTRELAMQWIRRVETFLGIAAAQVGLIGAGKKTIGQAVTVALVQSLCKCADEVSPHIGYLVVDECHRTPSRTFSEAVNRFDAHYMLGLSATPWRRDKLSPLIFWHLGDIHHEIAKADLVATGDVLAAEVMVRETAFRPYFDPTSDYSRMLSELTRDDARNRLIAGDVACELAARRGVCLVLSDRKKHCETLQALLRYRHKVAAELLTGDVSGAGRQEVLARLAAGEARVLIATGQLVGEGFDLPNLATLFLVTPVRFSGRVLQYLGRVLRPAPGKTRARVFDYVDVSVAPLMAAARARQRVYRG
ncbi:MAG: DEAD/DEAH box helicase [Desulfobacterales bacterium]